MAERWQQWMPFHIDKFRGSPEVQAMHPAARCGYLYLLASMWQTADCTISADPLDLATESGLGDEMWAIHGPRILRKMELVDGRLRNPVLYAEWAATKLTWDTKHIPPEELSHLRSAAGKAGNAKRWANRRLIANGSQNTSDLSQTDRKTSLTVTSTNTETRTETETETKAKTLALTPSGVRAGGNATKGVFELPLPGKQGEWQVPEMLFRELVEAYPGVTVMEELPRARVWLVSNPTRGKTAGGMPKFLNSWMARAQNEPRNRTGGTTHGRPGINESIAAKQRVLDAREAARRVADAQDRAGGSVEAGVSVVEPGGEQPAAGLVLRYPG